MSETLVDQHLHTAHDEGEIRDAAEALLKHPEFSAVIETFKLPPGSIVCTDPCESKLWWDNRPLTRPGIYGCDSHEIQPRFMTFMVYFR